MVPPSPSFVARPDRPSAAAYDFARPRAVSTRHLRTLDAVHTAFVAEIAATLTLALGEPVAARLLSTHEVLAADFARSRTAPAALVRASLGAESAPLAVDLGTAFAGFLVQRHYGGADPLSTAAPATRPLSALEGSVLQSRWLPLLGIAFADAWGSVPPAMEAVVSSPDALDLAAPAAAVVVTEIEVTVGDATAPLTVAYPASTIHLLLAGHGTDAAPPPADPSALGAVPVDLRVVLGQARVPLGDLRRLALGDVIPLDCTPTDALEVWSGGRIHFRAHAGAQGRRLAIEIASVSDRSPDR